MLFLQFEKRGFLYRKHSAVRLRHHGQDHVRERPKSLYAYISSYMNISYKWLKRFIEVPYEPVPLTQVLTSTGLECDTVEEVESIPGGLRGLVVGKVLTCIDHPDSDHLHITTVDVGGGEPLQIVCGAPNVAAGQTVVVATIGTVLTDGDKKITIKKGKMRGVESYGMICAEDEIGVGESHDGIMVLPDSVKAGTPAAEYFNLSSDYCFEVELTPNRVDAASHYGVARDLKAYLAAHTGEMPMVSLPDVSAFKSDKAEGGVKFKVEDAQGAPRYCGVTVRGIKVDRSPEWLRDLLTAVGQRPINNVVDITNFVLLGLGQPLHCFDLSKVKDETIEVRTVAEGTPFVTLDGVERKLSETDLMICDSEKPLCIAGVFGGLESGVTESTTDVFIESAWFNSTRIRRTARRHGLSTDASFRYERGTDPLIPPYAAKLAALMIKELAGGEICGQLQDSNPDPVNPIEIDFSLDYCASLIGKELPEKLLAVILKALDFEVGKTADARVLHLAVPPYRVDVTRPCDVVEEILRIYGYNNVEPDERISATPSQRGATDFSFQMQQKISEQLTAQGFNEILNNSLTSVSYYQDNELYPIEKCVKLLNPLSSDLGVMRQTLLYGGLEVIAHNVNRREKNLRLYEFGNVYAFESGKEATAANPLAQYRQESQLDLWLSGDYTLPSWNVKGAEASVFELKGIVANILNRLGIAEKSLRMVQYSDSLMPAALRIESKTGQEVGVLGVVGRSALEKFGIEQSVVWASLKWDVLMRLAAKKDVTFSPLPKTQAVNRDLALLLDKNIPFAAVEETIRKAERKLLGEVKLFDVYEGRNLPEGKKSYAVAMTLQDPEKTLNDKQIDAAMTRIVANLKKELGAELR